MLLRSLFHFFPGITAFTIALTGVFPLSVYGHKIHTFAWVSGNIVTVESAFSGNQPLVTGEVAVFENKTGALILQGSGNKQGIFTFEIPASAKTQSSDLLIRVTGGEGHQAEWLLPAADYMAGQTVPLAPAKAEIGVEDLEPVIRRVMEEELAEIKRGLAKSWERTPDFRDILGGIGYLVGLAGFASWLKNRRRNGND